MPRRKKINPRAAILEINLTLGPEESRHVIEMPDLKGNVTGSQFKADYLIGFVRQALSSKFGGSVK